MPDLVITQLSLENGFIYINYSLSPLLDSHSALLLDSKGQPLEASK